MLCDRLREANIPCELLSGAQRQTERIHSLVQLKQNKCRVLITTDLAARGIDAEKVSLVINYEVPGDKETYLHRMGRAGRYGMAPLWIIVSSALMFAHIYLEVGFVNENKMNYLFS